MMNEDHGNEARGFQRAADPDSTLAYMGSLVSFLVNAEEAGGGLSFMVIKARQGSEPPPHYHEREHEIFYMLEGEVDFFVEGVDHALHTGVGELAFLPSGKAHAMIALTPTATAVSVIHALDGRDVGVEGYLKQMANGPAESMELPEVADQYSTIDPAAMQAAVNSARQYGVIFLSPDEIAARLPAFAARLS